VVLDRGLIDRADRSKGHFRIFLLTALERFVKDTALRQKAAKRTPGEGMPPVPLEDLPELASDRGHVTPDRLFTYTWATTLLDEVLAKVEADCAHDGLGTHWEVFKARVLRPILEDAELIPVEDLCAQLKISNPSVAYNMVITVKRRFRAAILEALARQVRSPDQVEDELCSLLEALAGAG
jgi:hypothetical protein